MPAPVAFDAVGLSIQRSCNAHRFSVYNNFLASDIICAVNRPHNFSTSGANQANQSKNFSTIEHKGYVMQFFGIEVLLQIIEGKEVTMETAVDAIVVTPETYVEVMGKDAE